MPDPSSAGTDFARRRAVYGFFRRILCRRSCCATKSDRMNAASRRGKLELEAGRNIAAPFDYDLDPIGGNVGYNTPSIHRAGTLQRRSDVARAPDFTSKLPLLRRHASMMLPDHQ